MRKAIKKNTIAVSYDDSDIDGEWDNSPEYSDTRTEITVGKGIFKFVIDDFQLPGIQNVLAINSNAFALYLTYIEKVYESFGSPKKFYMSNEEVMEKRGWGEYAYRIAKKMLIDKGLLVTTRRYDKKTNRSLNSCLCLLPFKKDKNNYFPSKRDDARKQHDDFKYYQKVTQVLKDYWFKNGSERIHRPSVGKDSRYKNNDKMIKMLFLGSLLKKWLKSNKQQSNLLIRGKIFCSDSRGKYFTPRFYGDKNGYYFIPCLGNFTLIDTENDDKEIPLPNVLKGTEIATRGKSRVGRERQKATRAKPTCILRTTYYVLDTIVSKSLSKDKLKESYRKVDTLREHSKDSLKEEIKKLPNKEETKLPSKENINKSPNPSESFSKGSASSTAPAPKTLYNKNHAAFARLILKKSEDSGRKNTIKYDSATDLQAGADVLRLLEQRDTYTWETIKKVCLWAIDKTSGFWYQNFRTCMTLRRKWAGGEILKFESMKIDYERYNPPLEKKASGFKSSSQNRRNGDNRNRQNRKYPLRAYSVHNFSVTIPGTDFFKAKPFSTGTITEKSRKVRLERMFITGEDENGCPKLRDRTMVMFYDVFKDVPENQRNFLYSNFYDFIKDYEWVDLYLGNDYQTYDLCAESVDKYVTYFLKYLQRQTSLTIGPWSIKPSGGIYDQFIKWFSEDIHYTSDIKKALREKDVKAPIPKYLINRLRYKRENQQEARDRMKKREEDE